MYTMCKKVPLMALNYGQNGSDKMEKHYTDPGMILTHEGDDYDKFLNAVIPPVFMTSLHVFDTIESYFDADRYDNEHYFYGRVANPTVVIAEQKVAALENAAGALCFGSGMAAATIAVLTACTAGSHIICLHNAYGPLKDFVQKECVGRLGMTATFVNGETVEEFESVISEKTDLIILESPSSIVFALQDLAAVAKLAKRYGAKTYVDNTYCSPLYQKPLDLGIDFVMHTSSKYFGGHSDLIGGAIAVSDPALLKELRDRRELYGGIMGPMEAWLMIRGMRTLDVRLERVGKNAMAVAQFLEKHDKVAKVNYPGLESHPQYELMKRQQTGNTGLLSFVLDANAQETARFINALKVFKIGVSWGGFESLAFAPFITRTPEACAQERGAPSMIRLYCGLEGVDNLIADLTQAFECL